MEDKCDYGEFDAAWYLEEYYGSDAAVDNMKPEMEWFLNVFKQRKSCLIL